MILGIGRLREAARTPEKGAGGAGRGLPGLGEQQKPAITVSMRKRGFLLEIPQDCVGKEGVLPRL